ncbi:MAG: hypothetical protein IJZ26_00650 [Clostridia bacterium]|nr:hypothetical protein [Clostridia bacterium]
MKNSIIDDFINYNNKTSFAFNKNNVDFFNNVSLKTFDKFIELNSFSKLLEYKYLRNNLVDFDLINFNKKNMNGTITFSNGNEWFFKSTELDNSYIFAIRPMLNKDINVVFCEELSLKYIIYLNENGKTKTIKETPILNITGIDNGKNKRIIHMYDNEDLPAKFFIDVDEDMNVFKTKIIANCIKDDSVYYKKPGVFWVSNTIIEDGEMLNKGDIFNLDKQFFKQIKGKFDNEILEKLDFNSGIELVEKFTSNEKQM